MRELSAPLPSGADAPEAYGPHKGDGERLITLSEQHEAVQAILLASFP